MAQSKHDGNINSVFQQLSTKTDLQHIKHYNNDGTQSNSLTKANNTVVGGNNQSISQDFSMISPSTESLDNDHKPDHNTVPSSAQQQQLLSPLSQSISSSFSTSSSSSPSLSSSSSVPYEQHDIDHLRSHLHDHQQHQQQQQHHQQPYNIPIIHPPQLHLTYQNWIIFSDLHVKSSSIEICEEVLRTIHEDAVKRDAGIIFLGN